MDVDHNNTKELKNLLNLEINKLILDKWQFLERSWPKIKNRFNRRTKIKDTKNHNIITEIKNELLQNLDMFLYIIP